jgi:hypothetical protein
MVLPEMQILVGHSYGPLSGDTWSDQPGKVSIKLLDYLLCTNTSLSAQCKPLNFEPSACQSGHVSGTPYGFRHTIRFKWDISRDLLGELDLRH